MLSKQRRFSFKSSLPKRTFSSESFSVRYGKNSGGLKVAVVVSKRIDKRATVRNRIKRKILESIRKNMKTLNSLDLVFYVRKSILTSQDLEKEIVKIFEFIKYA